MKKSEIIEQVEFCTTLTNRLREAVTIHEKTRQEKGEKYHGWLASWGNQITERGASKTQIKTDIMRLRRELNTLSRMFED